MAGLPVPLVPHALDRRVDKHAARVQDADRADDGGVPEEAEVAQEVEGQDDHPHEEDGHLPVLQRRPVDADPPQASRQVVADDDQVREARQEAVGDDQQVRQPRQPLPEQVRPDAAILLLPRDLAAVAEQYVVVRRKEAAEDGEDQPRQHGAVVEGPRQREDAGTEDHLHGAGHRPQQRHALLRLAAGDEGLRAGVLPWLCLHGGGGSVRRGLRQGGDRP
mmetsp:Transcript_88594/g.251133  ORF Transcript_88594/g.251133 Transcript_88594/m.251133 type:complete len:220 (-) Transcript_88594:27-686(-)